MLRLNVGSPYWRVAMSAFIARRPCASASTPLTTTLSSTPIRRSHVENAVEARREEMDRALGQAQRVPQACADG